MLFATLDPRVVPIDSFFGEGGVACFGLVSPVLLGGAGLAYVPNLQATETL